MTCSEARDRMLQAASAELAGTSESELSLHLHACVHCRAAADWILEAERDLRLALTAATPRRGANEAMRMAQRRAGRRRWGWRWASLAAAAVLAAVLLERGRPIEPPAAPPSRTAVRSDFVVRTPPGRSVAVFRSDDPAIVVIWFF